MINAIVITYADGDMMIDKFEKEQYARLFIDESEAEQILIIGDNLKSEDHT